MLPHAFFILCALLQAQHVNNSDLLLVASFKPSVGQFCLDLPNGPMAAHETAQDAAVRIVEELTGFTATAPVGGAVSPWTQQHASLCPDTAKLVELVVDGAQALPYTVVARTTPVWPPPLVLCSDMVDK